MLDVETIKASGLCSGCGLCAGIGEGDRPAIVMKDAANGYRRPVVTEPVPEEQARRIDEVCPGANIVHGAEGEDAPDYHPVWGPVQTARLGWSSNAALRRNASSGGGLSALLTHLLATGEIDYVVQVSAAPDLPLRNMTRVSTGAEDVFASAGSRYAPSSPLEDIERHLAGHSRFAFVGKPCDVAGLRQLARIDPRVDEKVAYMFAFMCAGVPSHHGTSALLREMGIACDDEVTSFRYRGDGWPGFATAATASGETHRMDYDSSWGGVLNRYLQFRCKICPDGIGEFADVVCADGWYLDEANAPIFDERGGRSIILSRNAKGEALVQSAERAGALQTQPVTIEEIAAMQPYQARRKGLTGARLTAMALLGRRRPRYRGLALAENMKRLGPAKALRELLGTLRRLLRGQGRE